MNTTEGSALTPRQELARHLTRQHNAAAIARFKHKEMLAWHRGVHAHRETAEIHHRHSHDPSEFDGESVQHNDGKGR